MMEVMWTKKNQVSIRSDRDAHENEKLNAFAINEENGEIIDRINCSPEGQQCCQCTWTKLLADKVNESGKHIRCGEIKEDSFETFGSSYRNQFWYKNGLNVRIFTTVACLDNWKEVGEIQSLGDLLPDSILIAETCDREFHNVVEKIAFYVDENERGRNNWPFHFSQYINRESNFIRAGEKDLDMKEIKPLHSSYKNNIWAPVGSKLTISIKVHVAERIKSDADELLCKLLVKYKSAPPEKNEIDAWLKGFKMGQFTDIEYPQNKMEITPAFYVHFNKVIGICNYILAAQKSDEKADHDNDVYVKSVVEALNFFAQRYQNPETWCDVQIGLSKPATIASLLICVQDVGTTLSPFLIYIKEIVDSELDKTGANLAYFCYIQILWSIVSWKLTSEDEELQWTYNAYLRLSNLCFPVQRHGKESGEGIRVDYSFSQHNPSSGKYSQLNTASYGIVFLDRIFDAISISSGTFSISSASIEQLENFFLEGVGWSMFSHCFDFHCTGKAISRGMIGSAHLADWIDVLLANNPNNPTALHELKHRSDKDEKDRSFFVGNRIYFVNDYMTHLTEDFAFFHKCVSDRTVGTETGNGENLRGYFMGCGTYFLVKSGKEYFNIQPVWNWKMLPGTTVEQDQNLEFPLINWGYSAWGSHSFAGGASDGSVGINSMILTKLNVKHAKVSAVALEKCVILLGSDIDTSTAKYPVITSVNQCLLNGTVTVIYNDGRIEDVNDPFSETSSIITEVIHDGFYYKFDLMQQQNITVRVAEHLGRWRDVSMKGSLAEIKENVFSITVNHSNDEGGSYAYEIGRMHKYQGKYTVVNNRNGHAIIYNNGSKVIGTAFEAGGLTAALSNGIFVTPMDEMSFIIEIHDDKITITCADPNQKLKEAKLRLLTPTNASTVLRIPLPSEELAGHSKQITIPLSLECQYCCAKFIKGIKL